MDVSSGRRWCRVATALGLVVAVGCGGSASDVSVDDDPAATTSTTAAATLPLAEHFLDEPEATTVATDLAPSQATGSTVADPPAPERCGADAAEMWTAQVTPDGATAVIRMRNVSEAWCDFDVGRTPNIDPLIEPDVWLRPGETADLVVGPSATGCASPEVVREVRVGIVDESVVVPTALVSCGWWLTAFYPNDAADEPCDTADLEVATTTGTVVVRNTSAMPCRLGGLEAVDGAEVVARSDTAPEVRELLPGDVVAFGRPVGDACQGASSVVLVDEVVGGIEAFGVPCDVAFGLGAPAPWFGTEVGPPVGDSGDAADVIASLDPFGAGQ